MMPVKMAIVYKKVVREALQSDNIGLSGHPMTPISALGITRSQLGAGGDTSELQRSRRGSFA